MNANNLGVGPRTAAFLKERYPRPRAKLVAKDFKVSVATAERWLSGEAPTVAHVEAMTVFFGEQYVRTVFKESFEQQDSRIIALEVLMSDLFVASGIAGIMSGLSCVGSIMPSRNAFAGWLTWAGQSIGLVAQRPMLELPANPERTALIEGLIETVPAALPSPVTEHG